MKKRKIKLLKKFLLNILFVSLFMIIIATGNERRSIVVDNINNTKTIQLSHFVYKYNALVDSVNTRVVTTMNEAKLYGEKEKIEFLGTLTGYGPDCPGCIGKVYCAPWPYVTDGAIYYEDSIFGKIRIVAADYAIPCGSIVKISNYRYSENSNGEVMAIVLDRGSAIVGNTMDLLYSSEDDTVVIGRQRNIKFEILRWGW